MIRHLWTASLTIAIAAGGATAVLAQSAGNAGALLASTPTVPAAAAPAGSGSLAGQGLVKGGQAVVLASGAHGYGPATVVSGAVPESKGVTSGVTDGTAKAGKGLANTGGATQNGTIVNPDGAVAGAAKVPSNIDGARSQAAVIATPPK